MSSSVLLLGEATDDLVASFCFLKTVLKSFFDRSLRAYLQCSEVYEHIVNKQLSLSDLMSPYHCFPKLSEYRNTGFPKRPSKIDKISSNLKLWTRVIHRCPFYCFLLSFLSFAASQLVEKLPIKTASYAH